MHKREREFKLGRVVPWSVLSLKNISVADTPALGSENSVENAPLRSSLSLCGIDSSLGLTIPATRILAMLL